MWQEDGKHIQSLRSSARISTEKIKWSSDVKRDSDTFLHTNLSNRNWSGGIVTKRRLDVTKKKKE